MSLRRSTLLMSLAAASILGGCGQDVTYVGDTGIALDEAGVTSVYLNTCGESVTQLEVLSDKDRIVTYTVEEPASGVFTFILGQQPPAPWVMEQQGELNAGPEATLTTKTKVEGEPKNVRYRDAEIQMDTFAVVEPGRILVGTPHKSGDRTLSSPDQWPDICDHYKPPAQ